MSDKLIEALKSVVTEIQALTPIELINALKESGQSEFAQTIDMVHMFTSTIVHKRNKDDNNTLSLFSPIENKQLIPIKPPSLFDETRNLPIENIPLPHQSDGEDPPNVGLVSKTPYRDITHYTENWHLLNNTYELNIDK